MASGYGRGGRGAALLEAMNKPARKPGQTSPPREGGAGPAPPLQIGRGAALLQAQAQASALGRGQLPPPMGRGIAGLMAQPAQPTPAGSVSAPAPAAVPMGRGIASLQSVMGRGAPLASARSIPPQVSAPTPTRPTPPAAVPPPAVSPPHIQASPPQASQRPSPPQASPEAQGQAGAGDGQAPRKSNLEYMIDRMHLGESAVVRKGEAGRRLPLSANYIKLRCRNDGVYQYAVSYVPEIDSRNMRYKMLNEHLEVIGKTKAFDGAILFLPIKLPEQETVVKSQRQADGAEITIRIKLVKVVPYAACTQLYNVIFRRVMTTLRMCEVGRHFYDPHRPAQVPKHRLEVWPGYVTAIDEYEGGLMLLTDVSHRVLRMETALDLMRDIVQSNPRDFKDEIVRKLTGVTVLTRYNNKTYRVDDVMWDKTPKSTFETASGQQISFLDYYRKAYNKEIRDYDQPLLIHRPKKREQRGRRPLEMICLIPELCYCTGLTDDMRKDFMVMKDLGVHTRVMPTQRQLRLRQFCENVNSKPEARGLLEEWGLELDTNTITLEGRQLPHEEILFGRGKTQSAGEKADWNRALLNNPVITPVDLRDWMVVFTQRNANEARGFIQMLEKVCPAMGINVNRPTVQELQNDRTETYLRAIRDNIHNKLQLVVTIFPTARDDRYNAIKKLCCVDCEIPSQVINSKTIRASNKLRSVAAKVALQINCKLGGELWAVRIPPKSLMVVGIDTYHEATQGRRSVGGMVCSVNPTCTRWYSRVCFQQPGQELIDGLKVCFTAALRKYHEVNHTLPETIIVYRDGVGDGQLQAVANHEVKQLAECFMSFGEPYQPRFAVIVVQKRVNQRIFLRSGQGLDNPPPGTILDHTITRKLWYDFYLVSQHVTQGTVSPTHYVVVHDASNYKVDQIQKLTYKMTHLYYNWPGTVRVPAPCQYAHKLAYLVGQNIGKDPSHLLSDRLFFL